MNTISRMAGGTTTSSPGPGAQLVDLVLPTQPLEATILPNTILNASFRVVTPPAVAPTRFDPTPGTSNVVGIPLFMQMVHKDAASVANRVKPATLVNKMLPVGWIGDGARYVAACLWLWICLLDREFMNLGLPRVCQV